MPSDADKPEAAKNGTDRGGPEDAEAALVAEFRARLDFRWYALAAAALVPAFAAGVYHHGPWLFLTAAMSYAGCAAVELAFALVRRREAKPSRSLVFTGLVFALVLPPGTPLWMAALGGAFGTLFGKEAFGGTGHNFFNPALVGKCFLVLSWPTTMTTAVEAIELVPGAEARGYDAVGALLLGPSGEGAGEACGAAIILGGVFLIVMKMADWRTVGSVIAAAGVTAWALGLSKTLTIDPPLAAVLSGSVLLGAFFLAADPVTSPRTSAGKILCGALVGVLAVLIRNLSHYATYTEAAMFAVLLGNLFAPALDGAVAVISPGRAEEVPGQDGREATT